MTDQYVASHDEPDGRQGFGWTTALVIAVVQRTYSSELQRAYRKDDS